MPRLYLLRHGIAVPHGAPDIADDDRPLTPKGEHRARQVSHGLKRLGLKLDRIVTSPLPRAHRTAEILAEVLEQPDLLESADALRAGESAAAIASWLEGRAEKNLMLVGHNPAFSDLIGHLTIGPDAPSICELCKAGVAAFSSREGGATKWQIDWIARPKLIRRKADR